MDIWYNITHKQMAFSHHSMIVVAFLGVLFALGFIGIVFTAFKNR